MKIYSPKKFGEMVNRAVITLQRWDRLGTLKAHRTENNRRYYTHDQYLQYIGQKATEDKKNIVYFRVSGKNQKTDLDSQRKALEIFCTAKGLAVDDWFSDIGSGLNYNRKNFISIIDLVEIGGVSNIIIAHKDRFVRFGFEWFESFCKKHGTNIIVMNNESLSPQEEMTKDLLSIIHCFSSRLYGLRRYKKNIESIVNEKDN